MVGSWRLVAAGGWRRLVAGGWWRLAVDGSWLLVVGGPLGLSLRAVLSKKKKISSLKDAPGVNRRHGPNPATNKLSQGRKKGTSRSSRTAPARSDDGCLHIALVSITIHRVWKQPPPPPLCDILWLLLLYRALDSHPFFPPHVASGRCVLSAAAAGALAGVVSAFAEPSGWCVGAVLNVAWCAVCASAAPNNWRIEDVLVVAGVV